MGSVSKKLQLSTHERSRLSTAMKYLPSRHDDPVASQKTFMARFYQKLNTHASERGYTTSLDKHIPSISMK